MLYGPLGYVQLTKYGLAANGVEVTVIGADVSGHKSNDMLNRLERDVLAKAAEAWFDQPNTVTVQPKLQADLSLSLRQQQHLQERLNQRLNTLAK